MFRGCSLSTVVTHSCVHMCFRQVATVPTPLCMKSVDNFSRFVSKPLPSGPDKKWQTVIMPKIIGGSLAEHRKQTRHKLFAALSILMEDRGFDAITLAQIAKSAGIGRTAVYNHFPDKESLLVGFINHETQEYVATLERALADVVDPVEQLRTYVRAQLQLRRIFHLAPGPDLRSVLSRGTQKELRDHVVLIEAILRRIIESGIQTGVFPEQDLTVTVSLVHACLSGRTLNESEAGRREAVRATEAFVLRAVGAADPLT